MKVIDVSQYNGVINWKKVSKHCDGAIIRVGYRGYASASLVKDKRLGYNLTNASLNRIPLGVYFVTQAITEKEAKEEARFTVDLVKKYKLTYPIFIDSENANGGKGRADAGKLTKSKRTAILKAFCDEVKKLGYDGGVYASQSWFVDYTNLKELSKYFIWCAKYSSTAPSIKYDAWQYMSKGTIDGITGYVDVSNFYKKAKKTEPKKKTEKKTEKKKEAKKKSAETIAKEVIAGKWGNGEERKNKLKKAGYDYKIIQKLVNKLLK